MNMSIFSGPKFSPDGASGNVPVETNSTERALSLIVPRAVGKYFGEFCKRPCKAGGEELALGLLREYAKERQFQYESDIHNNAAVYVPGRGKGVDSPPVVLQFHTDMVFYPEYYDFAQHKITLCAEAGADGDSFVSSGGITTIGSDNRLGAGIAMALAEDSEIVDCPPLVLLATSGEEVGLLGAKEVSAGMFAGSPYLINLDNELLGGVFNRCAGQATGSIYMPLERAGIDESVRSDYQPVLVRLLNLPGGHSGANIHEQRGNAILTLVETLTSVMSVESEHPLYIGSLAGGDARNAIASDASAVLWIHKHEMATTREQIERLAMESVRDSVDENLFKPGKLPRVEFEELNESPMRAHLAEPISPKDADGMLGAIRTLRHGTIEADSHGNPELSNNVAQVIQRGAGIEIVCMTRHFDERRCVESLSQQFEQVGAISGVNIRPQIRSTSAGWFGGDSYRLLQVACDAYKSVTGEDAVVSGIHAGVEPGEFHKIVPQMEQVSLGPTILGAHSSEERFSVRSVEICYKQVAKMLEMLC